MNLSAVMDEVAAQLDTIDGLRAYEWPPDTVTPPAAIVDYPDLYEYDATYGRGMDRLTLLVWVIVGRPAARATRDLLGAYMDGSGARSIKAVIEAGSYTAFDEARVMSVEVDPVDIAGTVYMAARFNVDIAGKGAP